MYTNCLEHKIEGDKTTWASAHYFAYVLLFFFGFVKHMSEISLSISFCFFFFLFDKKQSVLILKLSSYVRNSVVVLCHKKLRMTIILTQFWNYKNVILIVENIIIRHIYTWVKCLFLLIQNWIVAMWIEYIVGIVENRFNDAGTALCVYRMYYSLRCIHSFCV